MPIRRLRRPRARARAAGCRRIGKLFGDSQHLRSRGLADAAAAVQRAIDRANRDVCQFRDFVNAGALAGQLRAQGVTTFNSAEIRSTELLPTMILKLPGSTT